MHTSIASRAIELSSSVELVHLLIDLQLYDVHGSVINYLVW